MAGGARTDRKIENAKKRKAYPSTVAVALQQVRPHQAAVVVGEGRLRLLAGAAVALAALLAAAAAAGVAAGRALAARVPLLLLMVRLLLPLLLIRWLLLPRLPLMLLPLMLLLVVRRIVLAVGVLMHRCVAASTAATASPAASTAASRRPHSLDKDLQPYHSRLLQRAVSVLRWRDASSSICRDLIFSWFCALTPWRLYQQHRIENS